MVLSGILSQQQKISSVTKQATAHSGEMVLWTGSIWVTADKSQTFHLRHDI